MKIALILILMAFGLVVPNSGFAATDMKSYGIHLNGALNGIREGTPGKLHWAKKDLGFIIRQEDWDPVHRSVAYYYLGVIESMANNLAAATQNYVAAIKLNPEYPEAYFNLGAVYYKQGLLKKAEEAFLKTIDLKPEYGRAHYSLGFVYFQQKKYDLATKHADKASEFGVPYRTLKEKLGKLAQNKSDRTIKD
jgi:tetratricopeptide (TPR) repeat protein